MRAQVEGPGFVPKELRFGKGRHRRVANLAGRRRSCASRFVEGDVRGRGRRSGRGRERRGRTASNSCCPAGRDLARRQHARHHGVGLCAGAEERARDRGRSDRPAHRRGPRDDDGGEEGRRGCDECGSRSARSSCSQLQSVSQGYVRRPLPRGEKRTHKPGEELLLYARDLRHMLEVERGQRQLLQSAYLQTVSALASALESKDTGTRAHSQRVQSYAERAGRCNRWEALAERPEHAVRIPAPRRRQDRDPRWHPAEAGPFERGGTADGMQTHTVLGEAMLSGVVFPEGRRGSRSCGRTTSAGMDARYPDGLVREEIPLGARVFAVADALDAMTSHRPYRRALSWSAARGEILEQRKRQFDPDVVDGVRRGRSRPPPDSPRAGSQPKEEVVPAKALAFASVDFDLTQDAARDPGADARLRARGDRAERVRLGSRPPLSARSSSRSSPRSA